MKTLLNRKLGYLSGLSAVVLLLAWWSVTANAQDNEHGKKELKNHAAHAAQVMQLKHINTQAQAEALKKGDLIAMDCSMCKNVSLHHVTADKSHVKLLTVGEKHKCICGGEVTVAGTGKGKNKDEQLRHDCSTCGKDVMFVCATSGQGHEQHGDTKHGHDKHEHGKSGQDKEHGNQK